jgi:hypothetical protein
MVILQYYSQNHVTSDKNSENNANENEVASIFARANESESITSNFEPMSMHPSMASRADETKRLSQKMRILLMKGVTGLYKVFPEENKNHQVILDQRISFLLRCFNIYIIRITSL